jgi:uncharacterized protein
VDDVEQPMQQISKKGLKVWRIHACITTFFVWLVLAAGAFLTYFFEFYTWIYIALGALAVIEAVCTIIIFPTIRWRHWRYEVRDQEIDLKYGLFIIKRVLVPMVRVQHVNTVQGPILKHYHLAEISISTAATVHTIPLLSEEEADMLRHKISTLARVAEEDV